MWHCISVVCTQFLKGGGDEMQEQGWQWSYYLMMECTLEQALKVMEDAQSQGYFEFKVENGSIYQRERF